MERSLARRIGPDTIAKLEAAAVRRLAEGESLLERGHGLGAVYLCGYAIEMYLAASYFRLIGFRPETYITEQIRKRVIAAATQQKLMGRTPHDLWGWAQWLVITRKRVSVGYNQGLRLKILGHARAAYAHWRPNLRYRAIVPTSSEVTTVVECARWFSDHYRDFWR